MTNVVVITVSDSCARGEREDISGPAVRAALQAAGLAAAEAVIVADERIEIEAALLTSAADGAALVVTTGGTGITARDVTPEATRAVCGRLLDGLAEQMRADGRRETPLAVLSRGVCGLMAGPRGEVLVVNLPGSPRGAVTSLGAILPVLPHALRLLRDPAAPHEMATEAREAAARDQPGAHAGEDGSQGRGTAGAETTAATDTKGRVETTAGGAGARSA